MGDAPASPASPVWAGVCSVPGCDKPRETSPKFSFRNRPASNPYCLKHRRQKDNHGHPTIKTVRVAARGGEMTPYLLKARRILTRIDSNEAILRYAQEVWQSYRDTTIEDTFREIPRGTKLHTNDLDKRVSPAGLSLTERLERARQGIGVTVKDYKLYSELDFLAETLDVREAFIGVVAHFIMRHEQPSRFGNDADSDTVFAYSIAKHFYRLTMKRTGSHKFNRRTGKSEVTSRFASLPAWMKRAVSSELLRVFSKPVSMVSKALVEESQAKETLREEAIQASYKISRCLTQEAIEEELNSLRQQLSIKTGLAASG